MTARGGSGPDGTEGRGSDGWLGLAAFSLLGVLAVVGADLVRRTVAWSASGPARSAFDAWTPTIVPAHAGYTVDPWPDRIWVTLLLALGLLLAAGWMLLPGRRRPVPRWLRALALWLCVVAAAVVVTGVAQLGEWILDIETFGGRGGSRIRGFTLPALGEAARWGLLWGWIPALASALIGATGPRIANRRGALVLLIALLTAAVAAGAGLATSTYGAALSARTEVASREDPASPDGQDPLAPADPPPSVAPVADPDFPTRCAADDVEVTIAGVDAATGSRLLALEARNTSSAACDLRGWPDLAFASADGEEIRPAIARTTRTPSGQDVDDEPVTIAPDGVARADLTWRAPTGRPEDLAVLMAPWAGADRIAETETLDIVDDGEMDLTPWHARAG
ncbi:DUF4232 domain-containing protein [Microbacterium sp. gxy059]|uniref:DUF4232 domain-containing protein n=1 Tax=Microbacterium sp. gxy059 TaxID=2957199 RepID=UPI003D95422C